MLSATQRNTAQHSATQRNTAQHSATQRIAAYSMIKTSKTKFFLRLFSSQYSIQPEVTNALRLFAHFKIGIVRYRYQYPI